MLLDQQPAWGLAACMPLQMQAALGGVLRTRVELMAGSHQTASIPSALQRDRHTLPAAAAPAS